MDQIKCSNNSLRTAELTIRSMEMKMSSNEKEFVQVKSKRQETIQRYDTTFMSNEHILMAVTRKLIEVAASVRISKDMIQTEMLKKMHSERLMLVQLQ